jgi:pyruvate dehydrogenase E2 component (dihydrolipoamide acetyltransferase)
MSAFKLPDLGEGLPDAEIVSWHVAEGDHVVVDQPLVAVETAKAVVEIPSPQAGRIAQLLVRPGERVAVGSPLLLFEEGPHPDAGTVVGALEMPTPTPKRADIETAGPKAAGGIPRATPAVRARAHELGVDLARLTPSGPGSSATMADVEAAAATTAPGTEALRGARRTMALNMARAWREVAHATLHDEADIAAWTDQQDVTVRLIRAIAVACAAEPTLNASFIGATTSLRSNAHVDIGLAIDSPDGLFVPVLRDVARATPADLRRQIEALKQAVRDRSLAPADLRQPTITLSNFGTIAGTHAALIIVPPQVAIVGAGRIGQRPAATKDTVELHRTLPLSLTFDHRAVSGGEAARFMRAAIVDLEDKE